MEVVTMMELLTLFIISLFVFAYYDGMRKIQKEDKEQKQRNTENRNN